MRDIRSWSTCVYTNSTYSSHTQLARGRLTNSGTNQHGLDGTGKRRMAQADDQHDAGPRSKRLRKLTNCSTQQSENVRLTRYHSPSRVLTPPINARKTVEKNVLMFLEKVPGWHALCACSARIKPCNSLPRLVAHAPHKVAGVRGPGIFLSLQGNDMAKCERTKLDTARSLHTAFCSAVMLYFEQCMTCLRQQGSQ